MAKPTPNYLKLFTEQAPAVAHPEARQAGFLTDVLEAFPRATGWSLRHVPGPSPAEISDSPWSALANPGAGLTPGHLILEAGRSETAGRRRRADEASARALASAIGRMLGELLSAQRVLWQREAELAAGVPVVPAADEAQHLAARLEAVLQGGAQAVGCDAAALYLLDEATTQLKLRSCWGLPHKRLTAPARPLRGALADLEALLGHAVVVEDTALMPSWKVPEDFPSAACVPVSTPTTILGTLWVFSRQRRPMDDHQTNILEVVAGRLAADLEREMLLREGIDGARLKRHIAAAEQWQRDQLPTIPPHVDGWDLSGWAVHAAGLGGSFFDWLCLPNDCLAVALGDAIGSPIEAALSAAAVKSAWRCHAPHESDVQQMLSELNRTLWTGSAGGQRAALSYGLIDPDRGQISWSTAGRMAVVLLTDDGWKSLTAPGPLLGESPEACFPVQGVKLGFGQVLIIATEGVVRASDAQGRPFGEAGLAEATIGHRLSSAEQLTTLIRDRLGSHCPGPMGDDGSVLVVKRADP